MTQARMTAAHAPGVLERLDGRAVSEPDAAEVRAFLVVRNEVERLPWTLAHHRALGVDRFFVIDNASSDGTLELLLEQHDVHVFRTTESYAHARLGIDWIEALLHTYALGQWCLVLDADEHLVYEDSEHVRLRELCNMLEQRQLNCLATTFVDLYSANAIAATRPNRSTPMLEQCPYFDASGYVPMPVPGARLPRIYGGVRARLFWPTVELQQEAARAGSYAAQGFDEQAYLELHGDVKSAVDAGELTSGFEHFAMYGHHERRAVVLKHVTDWPEAAYLRAHSDVSSAVDDGTFSSGLEHFMKHGQFERRIAGDRDWPPCLSQVPLMKWRADMRLHHGRHWLDGHNWRRADAVGGALLHFKLMAKLTETQDESARSAGCAAQSWSEENERYRSALQRNPALSALTAESVRYTHSRQLVDLGIIQPIADL